MTLREAYQAVLDQFDPVSGPTYEASPGQPMGHPGMDLESRPFQLIRTLVHRR